MPPRSKPNAVQDAPGSLGDLGFLDDVTTKPVITEAHSPSTDDLKSSSSESVDSSKRQPSRASKHHVSLYITPQVDREMKRIALDGEKKGWEIYHQAIREYLDRHGKSFDDLMRQG